MNQECEEILQQGKHLHKIIKGSSDLKKNVFQINSFFSKTQLSLKARTSEKVPYYGVHEKYFYNTSMTRLIKHLFLI